MTDDGLRKGAVQVVEDRLVGDFAGQPDIARRNIADRRRHQRAAPMCRCSQQMRDAVAAETIEMIADRLAGAGQNKRNAAEHGAQENLQATIAADVVERAPDCVVDDRPAAKRRGQAGERVHHHFWHAGSAGSEHDPLGLARGGGKPPGRRNLRSTGNADRQIERGACCRALVDDHRVDVSAGDERREVLGIGIGRQDSKTARDAVELDQGERRGQLTAGGDEYGSTGQFFEPAAEAGAVGKIGDADARVAIEEEALLRTDILAQRLRLSVRHFRRLSRNRRKSRETARPPTP